MKPSISMQSERTWTSFATSLADVAACTNCEKSLNPYTSHRYSLNSFESRSRRVRSFCCCLQGFDAGDAYCTSPCSLLPWSRTCHPCIRWRCTLMYRSTPEILCWTPVAQGFHTWSSISTSPQNHAQGSGRPFRLNCGSRCHGLR